MQLFICAQVNESSATNRIHRPFFPTRRNADDYMASAQVKPQPTSHWGCMNCVVSRRAPVALQMFSCSRSCCRGPDILEEHLRCPEWQPYSQWQPSASTRKRNELRWSQFMCWNLSYLQLLPFFSHLQMWLSLAYPLNRWSYLMRRGSRSHFCFHISSSKNDTNLDNRQGLLLYIFYEDKRVNALPKMWIIRYQIKL